MGPLPARRMRRDTGNRQSVLHLSKELAATLGKDFFQSVVKHLSAAFQADCVYLGELVGPNRARIRTVAVFGAKESPQGFEQIVTGTASGQVLSDGAYFRSKDIAVVFPQDDVIRSLEAQGFLGVRLSDSTGQPIGLLAMIFKRGITNLQVVKSVLEAFVPRAAAELERKRFDDMHREIEERYHAFISSNPDAMWRIELEEPVPLNLTDEEQVELIYRSGYLAECNHSLAMLAGVESTDELLGRRFSDVAVRINPGAREELRAAVRSGFRSLTVENAIQDDAGGTVYRLRSHLGIVENGRLLRLWGTSRDITGLRRTELSLAASERRFREVLEGVHLPAVMLDLRGGVVFANECFVSLAQRSREELSALAWLNGVVPAAESETWKASTLQDDSNRRSCLHFEGTILAPKGPPRSISWDTIALYDSNNRLVGVAGIGRDITRQRSLEIEIRQSQKLESIGRLAAGVAHDFNNLLMTILGESEQLLGMVGSDPAREGLFVINNAAVQCSQLTAELLMFGRQQPLKPRLIRLNDVIVADEALIRSLTSQHIELIFDLEPALGLVYADPAHIQRSVASLVTNARDAMTHGGTLTVSTSNLTLVEEAAAYPGVSPGSYVRLRFPTQARA